MFDWIPNRIKPFQIKPNGFEPIRIVFEWFGLLQYRTEPLKSFSKPILKPGLNCFELILTVQFRTESTVSNQFENGSKSTKEIRYRTKQFGSVQLQMVSVAGQSERSIYSFEIVSKQTEKKFSLALKIIFREKLHHDDNQTTK